jgi:hypothetical protein
MESLWLLVGSDFTWNVLGLGFESCPQSSQHWPRSISRLWAPARHAQRCGFDTKLGITTIRSGPRRMKDKIRQLNASHIFQTQIESVGCASRPMVPGNQIPVSLPSDIIRAWWVRGGMSVLSPGLQACQHVPGLLHSSGV